VPIQLQNEPVGVIGTGAMGMGVVRSLLRGGFAVVARDIVPTVQAEAAALGAQVADSPAAVARRAAIVIVLVVDAPQVDTVLFGDGGVVSAGVPGTIVVLSSTVDPEYTAALVPRLAAAGTTLLDAPVSGGPARAAAGTMTIMVAGAAAAQAHCASVFAAIAGKVFAVSGQAGDAAKLKIVNNLLAAANLAAGAEALALARKAGLDLAQVVAVVGASSGASWMFADRMPRALAGDYAPRAAARILAKDVGIAVDLAARLGCDAPFAAAARAAFLATLDAGLGEEDDAAITKLFAARAGVPPPEA
jgi:putative dehydrogenase